MSSLVVLAFDTMDGAENMREKMYQLQRRELITIDDAAIAVRKENGQVKVKQAYSLVGAGALGGSFWGLLIGVIFWMPWLGMAVGAVTGALGGKFTDIGIDDSFIKEVANTVQPGDSALFLLARDAQMERIEQELSDYEFEILETNLSPEDEDRLREAFAAEEISG
ncbi:Uncharacterized membrane protein [Halogeometricum rufum]|uniref:Uncharacterized membrane protein n=2 Tax=Halogeometricum rufum TaxID=553469 RepID=A0A1I6IGG8_9EURY|nr:DUF1269 domain-containing protein [Halogeometricum rufum]SFR65783.1 Uncharacterized membrane protein [Halogeometricum rufum]